VAEELLGFAVRLILDEERARLESKRVEKPAGERAARLGGERVERPSGKIYYYKLQATPAGEHVRLPEPCFSFTLINDGDSPILLLVNTDKNHVWEEVGPGEDIRLDLGRPVIKDFKVKCESGSSNVRVWCVA
jgi:hypothetical protein